MKKKIPLVVYGFTLLSMVLSAGAISQNFDTWATTDNNPHTITNSGWIISDAIVKDDGFDTPKSAPNAVFLHLASGSYLQTPELPSGIGKINFYCKMYKYANLSSMPIEVSTSLDGTNWTSVATIDCTSKTTWQFKSVAINNDYVRYVRIIKTLATSGANLLGIDDVTTTIPPATVTITNITTIPGTPEINDTVDVSCTITPSPMAYSVSATLSYAIGTNAYTVINMTNIGTQNLFITDNKIPGQDVDTKVKYYITATFSGNEAQSPAFYPVGGETAPAFYKVNNRAFLSDYKFMDITGSTSGSMIMENDYQWLTVINNSSAIPNANLRFQGTETNLVTTKLWGDATQTSATLPIFSTAILNDAAINLASLPAGQTMLRFNETSLNYTIRRANYQDFDLWPDAPTYSTSTFNGWKAVNAKIETPADSDRKLRGKICILNSNATSWVQSLNITNGIGEISFWYRNWETNGTPETKCYIQLSRTGGTNDTEWSTTDTIKTIDNTNYKKYSLQLNDYNNHYIRILGNTNTTANAALCIDELMILHGGSAVNMTNLVTIPQNPTVGDPIDIQIDITPILGASNLLATAYYRSGTFDSYHPLLMTNISANTYKTISPIPAGSGGDNGAGDVQYYVECEFDGLESDLSSPMQYPVEAPETPKSVTINPATVIITNVVNSPNPVAVNTPITITADILPVDGTIDINPSVWYRIGNSGNFAEIVMNENGSPTNFITINPIPGQSVAGTYIQYYLEVNFVGPGAISPSNYPAIGYITIPIHAADLTSTFDSVNVEGDINTNLYLIENNIWQSIYPLNSNLVNGNFHFNTTIGTISNHFGVASQPFTNMPVFGNYLITTNNIIMGGTNSGNIVLRFNENNNTYSAQLCDYVDFENFNNANSAFSTYTNNDNWIISNARITSAGETEKAFRGNSTILNSNGIAYVKSPNLTNGIGEVSFWYRNWWEDSTTEPITIFIQKSIDGETGWETIATIDNVINFNYLHYSGFFYEPNYHYIRITTSTETPRTLLLLDEIIVSEAGPGTTFSNLTNTPASPEVPESVSVSVDIDTVHYASDIQATLWYRFGTNGTFDSIAMYHSSSNTYTTVSDLPRGFNGTVQYFVEADFEGIEKTPRTFTTNPDGGPYTPASYISSGNSALFVDFDDWTTTDNTPHTITNNGWVISDSIIKNSGFDSVVSATNAAWFLPSTIGTLQAPQSLYGVGTISFHCKMYKYATESSIPLKLLTSEDGINWSLKATINCDSTTVWQYNAITLDDQNIKYVKIVKDSISSGANLVALDNVLITYPASIVTITNVTLTPEYPKDTQSTKVSCTITSANSGFPSANITAQLNYKLSSESNYTVIDMIKDGTTFTSEEIPPIAPGEMIEYYITSSFAGYHGAQSDNRSPSYYPIGDAGVVTNQFYLPPTNNPAAYYGRQEFLSTQHSFDAWTNSTAPGSYIDQGWTFNEIQVTKLNAGKWFSTPYAVEFLNDGNNFDSYIQSPTLSNGVGIISFFTRNNKEGNINLQVSVSENGTDYTLVQNITTSTNTLWTRHAIEINKHIPVTIRISKGDTTGPGYTTFLDNIEISYIPSDITINNIVFTPGYPAVGQDVFLKCKIIASSNLYEAASDINAKLYYRNKSRGEINYSGPLNMIHNGSTFRTFSPIAGVVNGSRDIIEFYVEVNFDGYYYKSEKNSHSPAFYPAGNIGQSSSQYYTPPLNTPDNYQVRPYLSNYGNLTVAVSNITVTMTQNTDHEWNGFLFIDSDMPNVPLFINGFGFYTGTNYSDNVNTWSDTNQTRTILPFAGTMQENGNGTTLLAPERGAYLIRFNEDSLGYIIERAAFQDFNTWPANPDYFEASFSQSKVTHYPENFNAWTGSVTGSFPDNFETWTNNPTYINVERADGDFGWIVAQSKIIRQLAFTNSIIQNGYACQLYPAEGFGSIKTTVNSWDGTGQMKIEYRCVDDTFAPTLYSDSINWNASMVKGTFKASAMPYNSSKNILGGNIWISLIGRHVDDRNYYELRREQVSMNKYLYSIYKIKNDIRYNLASLSPYNGTLINNEEEMSMLISTYNGSNVLIEAYRDDDLILQAFDENDPITMQGKTGIRTKGVDTVADDVYAGISRQLTFKGWPYKSGVTSFTKDGWTVEHANSITADSYVELLKKSGATGEPAIISPLLPHGAGNISVRAKRGSQSSSPCKLIFQWSTDKTTWNTIANKDITISDANWKYYNKDNLVGGAFNITNENIYLRLVNDTADNSLFLDDIRIEPSPTTGGNWNFENGFADGWFASYDNWTVNNGKYNGAGIVSPISMTFEVAPDYAPNSWTTITNINSKANIEYQMANVNFNIADPYIPRLRHTFGDASLVVNSIEISSWHGKNNSGTNGWRTQAGWINSGGFGSNCVELTRSRALIGEEQFLLSPIMTNGVGTISFNYIQTDTNSTILAIQRNDDTNGLWTTMTIITNNIVNDWNDPLSLFTYNVRTNDSMFIRILNLTSNNTTIKIDNLNISDFSAKDEFTWTAYNSLITASLPDKLRNSEGNIKCGILNSNDVDDVDQVQSPLNEDKPYIQSGFLKDGIGEISFWYRSWDTNNTPTMRIKIAPEKDTPASNWVTLATIPNINSTNYQHYETVIYDTSNHYVRFYADTEASSAGRICMDDIIITAPYGADVAFQYLSINPEIPLQTDNVYIKANINRTFLNPSNITLTAYWRADVTNDWGTWENSNPLPMEYISGSGNYPIGIWKTIDPIPAQPVDSLIQYYVEASYNGIFSEKSSPKEERSFTNPSYYYPVDLNNGLVNTNPYYYVFSSLPGEVWLNEVNISDGFLTGIITTQYLELAGHAGVDIGNWGIEVINDSFIGKGWYSVSSGTVLPNNTNGYGFWLLGDGLMPGADMLITNEIPKNGGIRLYRSMGAIEDGICFGSSGAALGMPTIDTNLVYIGFDDDFFGENPLALIGTGSNVTDFTEWADNRNYTVRAENDGQTLTPLDAPLFQIQITGASRNGNQIWLVFYTTANYDIQPQPWYSTNLLDSNSWTPVPVITEETYNNGIYTQKFDAVDSPVESYKIIGTTQ